MLGFETLRGLVLDVASPHTLHHTRPTLLVLTLFVAGIVLGFLGFMALVVSVQAAQRSAKAATNLASGVTRRLKRRFSGPSNEVEGSPHVGRPSTLSNLITSCPSPNIVGTSWSAGMALPRQGSKLIAAIL
uniref:Uncharacterized protein n=1 Tax=Hemiselmis andersenii TaxID=464988 RepID=A0A6T8MR76_HEMAN|mmetsp:Transcript_29415/g.68725  ORF Transcript_29415/g.68725 Transcript_29415/m.68725 type:complete len:131 (+) Transcript_29415:420-812(+)